MTVTNQDGNKRTEINFLRLLHRCEIMAKESHGNFEWRFEKYVGSLVEFLSQLKKMTTNQPRHEDLIDYTRRVELLKGLIEIEKLPTSMLKSLAVEQLVPSKNHDSVDAFSLKDSKVPKATLSHQLHIESKSKCLKNMKDELFGSKSASTTATIASLRQRQVPSTMTTTTAEEDMDAVLKYHQQIQDKLAEEMVTLARNLKENASIAGRIVRDDKEKLLKSTAQAEDNYGKLKVESERLEYHVANACSWWIWIMLVIVIITFVWMVIFMRLFPKG